MDFEPASVGRSVLDGCGEASGNFEAQQSAVCFSVNFVAFVASWPTFPPSQLGFSARFPLLFLISRRFRARTLHPLVPLNYGIYKVF